MINIILFLFKYSDSLFNFPDTASKFRTVAMFTTADLHTVFNPLKPNDNYMSHLLQQFTSL
jgi:hypothetical protein